MTFIATVIAKNGAAIIADSLVTTSQPVIEYGDFLAFFDDKVKGSKDKEIKLDPGEIVNLFETRPHHTKDYEEKLFEYDSHTAITTAGSAQINGKRIGHLIEEISEKNLRTKGYGNKKIETKVKDLCGELTTVVIEHLKKHSSIGNTTLIVTNYTPNKNQCKVFKVTIRSASSEQLKEKNFDFVTYSKPSDVEKVICDGQNRISEKILFGDFPTVFGLIPRIVNQVAEDFGINKSKVHDKYIQALRDNRNIVPSSIFSDMKILRLTDLSLQQAVELAALLMRLEMDFQSYTEDIPTVGGVIKLAVIDKNGFRYISGDQITRPNNI